MPTGEFDNLLVVNGYKDGFIGANKVYIGRFRKAQDSSEELQASPLANPYIIGVDGDREEVIDKYRLWLGEWMEQGLLGNTNPVYEEVSRLTELYRLTHELKLSCYCAPQACHGDIIAEWIMIMYPKN